MFSIRSVRSRFLCSFHAVCAPCERSSFRPRPVGVSASIHGGPWFYFSTWHLAPAGVNTRLHPERLRVYQDLVGFLHCTSDRSPAERPRLCIRYRPGHPGGRQSAIVGAQPFCLPPQSTNTPWDFIMARMKPSGKGGRKRPPQLRFHPR